MVLIWRGFGIAVPIILVISGIITSYFFEDSRFGNGYYMGWTMFWASLPLGVMALAIFGMKKEEPVLEPGEIYEPPRHDFFWLPVWLWAAGFLGGGLYLIFKGPSESTSYSETDYDVENTIPDGDDKTGGEMDIWVWNPASDSAYISITNKDGTKEMDQYVGARSVIYGTYDSGPYTFEYGEISQRLKLPTPEYEGENAYERAWFVMDRSLDLVLVDVTAACADTITRDDIRDINWEYKIESRYTGDQLIIAQLYFDEDDMTYTVKSPGFKLPLEHAENERVYSLVPINRDEEVNDEFLDEAIIKLCFND